MNNKGFSKVSILIALVILVGGGILIWQYVKIPKEVEHPEDRDTEEVAKHETADWKTYKNEDYGFEIKYPKDWNLKAGKHLTLFLSAEKPPIIFSARVRDPYSDEEINCIPSYNSYGGERILGKKKINDFEFCKIFGESDGEVLEIFYLAVKNEDVGVDIGFYRSGYYEGSDYALSEEKLESELKILNQMLSTFRFID